MNFPEELLEKTLPESKENEIGLCGCWFARRKTFGDVRYILRNGYVEVICVVALNIPTIR